MAFAVLPASSGDLWAMADLPMSFYGPMVRALLAGRKSQTRRVLDSACEEPPAFVRDGVITAYDERGRPYRWPRTAGVGDRLWVKEACGRRLASFFGIEATNGVEEAFYRADDEGVVNEHEFNLCPWWKGPSLSPRYMPRWASRLTLNVTNVRVERLHDISKGDAVAEGLLKLKATGRYVIAQGDQHFGFAHRDPRVIYENLWNDIHGPDAWADNPWVAATSFTIERRNIDAVALALK